MKGWIDRVFANGWVYDDTSGKVVKKLRHLPVHLVGIGGADARTYKRHGYFSAIKTQIDCGIFDYCGASVVTSELLLDSDAGNGAAHIEMARRIGSDIFKAGDRAASGGLTRDVIAAAAK
ncbi:putative NADPH-quinone reductase (modulator of drug activity B) [Rhizobium sp. CF142]|nr:putative NADPH-quinone reductase (modulator of drug activity B) [Rhizobium sp. CF142]